MLTVACVEHGDYLSRGKEYVSKLRSMVRRHLSQPHEFICLTDDPTRHPNIHCQTLPNREKEGLTGWWSKLYLFSPNRFQGRVLYLDLDTVVTGSLDELVGHKGIIHLKDWGWTQNDYGSGVMIWDAGEYSKIWTKYNSNVPHRFRGDQDWIKAVSKWPALPVGIAVSYRYLAREFPPMFASVICFHGVDKPHAVTTGWVPEAWR